MIRKRQFTSIDCFCGSGGLSLGLKQAGFDICLAFDNDVAAIETHSRNIPGLAKLADIRQIVSADILKEAGLKKGMVDLVAGGPPCQGFSVQRRGSDTDDRNNLVADYLRFCSLVMPRFVLMENVGGILSTRGEVHFAAVVKGLEKLGYFVQFRKLNALDYGVPQNRRRVFLIAELPQSGGLKFEWPNSDNNKKIRTVKDAIWDLRNKPDKYLPNHTADRLSSLNIERIKALKPGQGRNSLPLNLQLKCHRNNSTHRHLDTYGRMAWNLPAPTITARFDSFSRGRFGHPTANRTITLREGARLQTFPDEFEFYGTKVEVARQIGNAVPPVLAKEIGKKIIEALKQ